MVKTKIILISMLSLLASCSYFKSKALSSMSELMLDKSSNLTKESSFNFFEQSTPGNLKLIESFHFIDPKDKNFLSMLIKGHGGLAYSIYDTLALKDRLQDKDYSYNKDQSLIHYTKSLDYGIKYVELNGLKFEDLKSKELDSVLEDHFDEDDLVPLFYFAQSWGQLINSSRNNIYLISEIAYVEKILNWVCMKNPIFEKGVCDLYKAVFEAQKPRIMGGSPKVAKELFELAMNRYPKNLLIRVSYIEFALIPLAQTAEYYRQRKILADEFYQWRRVLDYTKRVNQPIKYTPNDDTNLFNAIALKRFNTILQFEKEIF